MVLIKVQVTSKLLGPRPGELAALPACVARRVEAIKEQVWYIYFGDECPYERDEITVEFVR